MILSIDTVHQRLKLSSIMRDTYVEVEDRGKMKINEAYAYKGNLPTGANNFSAKPLFITNTGGNNNNKSFLHISN
ncbi:LCP family protein [Clostridium formicaceticum]|uniref:LCP family glycopolymer transferase n=1 Tax=Clostridium formicaceticum TaxID=1497 RepID=UPI0009DA13DB|nr:LCP family protein [Clostridium formicaceticum]